MRQLGPYQLLRKIGSGGMAEVWSARVVGTNASEDRFFAIKLLAAHLAEKPEYRDMFLAEARLSMMLGHANIVQVYDAVAHEQDCYMVMELISGMTLSQFQRASVRAGQQLPLHISAYIVGELLRALSYAHQVQTEAGSTIVHRDVSPQNVMVTSSGEVKLMDFGIARYASQETQGAFVKGKLQYMPPEQLRKQTRRPTVDLYAVGAILHELIDGHRFRGKLGQAELIRMVMDGEVPPLREPTKVPSALDLVRRGLLEPDERRRIQTARKALGMLARWPEYRESNAELRGLVGCHVDINSVFQVPESTKVSSVPEGSFSGVPSPETAEHPAAASDAQFDSMQAAQTSPTGSEITRDDADPEVLSASHVVAVPARRRQLKGWPFALGGVVVAAGLGVTLFALGPQGSRSAGDDADSKAALADSQDPTGSDADAQPTVPDPAAVDPPTADPAIAEPATADPATADSATADSATADLDLDEPEVADGAQPEVEDAAAVDPEEAELIPITFVANEFFFVYVRVNGRVLTLEPRKRVQLPPGNYRVQLRQSKDEPWTSAGRIELEAGGSYRVEMTQPAGLQLVKT